MYLGYLRGFIRDFADLVALVGAVLISSVTYTSAGTWLTRTFSVPGSFANTSGFFLVWFLVMLLYYAVMTFFYDLVPENIRKAKYNKWAGLLPALARGLLYTWFATNLLSFLVVSGQFKETFDGSFFYKYFTKNNVRVSEFVSKTFGATVADTIDFLTVKPQSSESVQLGFSTTAVTVDTVSAQKMLVLINKARTDRGLSELVLDDKLTAVGEEHGRDMFARGYFSHNTPEGKTPFDRMDEAGIFYLIAGENLALAPTVEEAFAGLMESPGHKANMLSLDYGKVGIGAIDGGIYGKMFAQEFTN